MRSLLQNCSPHHHPYRWMFVNVVVLLWSMLLLARIINNTETNDANEKGGIEYNYLLYNFATCIIWLIEVTFNVLDHKKYFDPTAGSGGDTLLEQPSHTASRAERTKREVVALWIEFALAAYFFIDSTVVWHLSREQIHREAKGMTVDVFVNIAGYAFLVYRQFVDWKTSGQNHVGGSVDTTNPIV